MHGLTGNNALRLKSVALGPGHTEDAAVRVGQRDERSQGRMLDRPPLPNRFDLDGGERHYRHRLQGFGQRDKLRRIGLIQTYRLCERKLAGTGSPKSSEMGAAPEATTQIMGQGSHVGAS